MYPNTRPSSVRALADRGEIYLVAVRDDAEATRRRRVQLRVPPRNRLIDEPDHFEPSFTPTLFELCHIDCPGSSDARR